ncbi:hypothetical protein ACFL27_26800, partial [candidate division CSSED10-310 bacterium]
MKKYFLLIISLGLIVIFLYLNGGIPAISQKLPHPQREIQAQKIQFLYLLLVVPAILCLSSVLSQLRPLARGLGYSGHWLFTLDRRYFMVLVFFIGFASSALIQYFYLHKLPTIIDSHNNYFQAKIFAQGRIWAPSYPDTEKFFDFVAIMNKDGKRYGSVFAGHPMVLCLGEILGVAWLVNPIQGGLIVIFIYLLGAVFFTDTVGRFAAILSLSSPFKIFQCAIFMVHPTVTLWILIFLWILFRYFEKPLLQRAIWLGLSAGFLYLVRPQSAFPILVPFALYYCVYLLRRQIPVIHTFITVFLIIFSINGSFLYNKRLTGEYLVTPRDIVAPSLTLGFGDKVGKPMGEGRFSGHTWANGCRHTAENCKLLSRESLCWGGFTFLFLLPAFWSQRKSVIPFLMLLSGLLLMTLFFAYPINSPLFGPRYYFELLPFYLLLIAQGMVFTRTWIKEHTETWWGKGLDESTIPAIVIPLFILFAFIFIV